MPREEPRPGRARLGARIALLSGASAIGLLLAEIGARAWLPEPQVVRIERADHAGRLAAERSQAVVTRVPSHPEEASGSLYVETPTGRRLRANSRVVIERHALSGRRIVIETNSLGYRNPELGAKTGPRLLFLGDSITFGDYVPERHTFVRRVEARAAADGRRWETVNAGVGAVGLDQEIGILLETGLATQPDVVVLDFYLNDFQASPGIRVIELPTPLDRSVLLHHASHAVAAGLASVRLSLGGPAEDLIDYDAWIEALEADWPAPRGAEEAAFRRQARETIFDWGGAFSPKAWERLRPRLQELAGLAEAHGFALVVTAFPVRAQVEARDVYDRPQRRLAELLATLGVPMLDLLPVLRSADRAGGPPLFYDHCHPTPHGNAVVAEAIYAFLAGQVAPGRDAGRPVAASWPP